MGNFSSFWVVGAIKLALIFMLFSLVTACSGGGQKLISAFKSEKEFTSQTNLKMVDFLPIPEHARVGSGVLLARGDTLNIDIFNVDSLDKTVQVDASGNISLPLIGSVFVLEKNVQTLELELEDRYGSNYLQSPQITVSLKNSLARQATIDGEFSQPGLYPIGSEATLMQVVALGGGLTEIADETRLFIFRKINEQEYVRPVNLKKVREGRHKNPRIFGGDIVVAFSSKQKIIQQNLREALGMAASAARVARPF